MPHLAAQVAVSPPPCCEKIKQTETNCRTKLPHMDFLLKTTHTDDGGSPILGCEDDGIHDGFRARGEFLKFKHADRTTKVNKFLFKI